MIGVAFNSDNKILRIWILIKRVKSHFNLDYFRDIRYAFYIFRKWFKFNTYIFLKNIFFSKKISRILYLISFFRIIHDKILLKIIGKISKWIKRINLLSKL